MWCQVWAEQGQNRLLTGRTSPAFNESTIQSGRTMGLGSLQQASSHADDCPHLLTSQAGSLEQHLVPLSPQSRQLDACAVSESVQKIRELLHAIDPPHLLEQLDLTVCQMTADDVCHRRASIVDYKGSAVQGHDLPQLLQHSARTRSARCSSAGSTVTQRHDLPQLLQHRIRALCGAYCTA